MDNLTDILARKDFDVPPEVITIKRYVLEHFKADVGVRLSDKVIVITARSSSLISMLRLHAHEMQRAAATDKKIVLRVG